MQKIDFTIGLRGGIPKIFQVIERINAFSILPVHDFLLLVKPGWEMQPLFNPFNNFNVLKQPPCRTAASPLPKFSPYALDHNTGGRNVGFFVERTINNNEKPAILCQHYQHPFWT